MKPTILLLALVLTVPSSGAESGNKQRKEKREHRDLAELVAELGHEQWEKRHAAEEELLGRGVEVISHLDSALSASNPEASSPEASNPGGSNPEKIRRIRYLLDRIDPSVGVFDVVRIDLREQPKIVTTAHGSSAPGAAFTVESAPVAADPSLSFQLDWNPLSDEVLELGVTRSDSSTTAGSSTKAATQRFVSVSPAVHLFDLGEEDRYLRGGTVLERERYPYMILVYQRRFRHSTLTERAPAKDSNSLWAEIVATLLDQAGGRGSRERLAALNLLGRLGVEEAREMFLKAVDAPVNDDPRAFDSGALGLGTLGRLDPTTAATSVPLLRQVLDRNRVSTGSANNRDETELAKMRAALLLAELDHFDGLPHLLELLEKKDIFKIHTVMASLVDLLPRISRTPELRHRVLDIALRNDVLGEIPWQTPEAEYLLVKCLELLDPEDEQDRARAKGVMSTMERLAAGKFVANRVPFGRIVPIWLRAARLSSEDSTRDSNSGESEIDETPLFEAVLAAGGGLSSVTQVVSEIGIAFSGRPLPNTLFVAVLRRFRVLLESETSSTQFLQRRMVDFSRKLTLAPDQLGPLVDLLTELIDRKSDSSPNITLDLKRELNRWTGLEVPLPSGRSRVRKSQRKGTAAKSKSSDTNPWKTWVQNDDLVATRETELLREAVSQHGASPAPLVYFEFDLHLPPASSAAGEEPAPLKILDGRRVEIVPRQTYAYRDRWGNRRGLFLDDYTASRSTPKRYRLNDGWTLTEGVPSFLTGSFSKIRVEWHATSRLLPRGYSVRRRNRDGYKTLALIAPPPERAGGAPPDYPGVPQELWETFVAEHVLKTPEGMRPNEARRLLNVIGELRLPGTRKLLRELLRTTSSASTAEETASKLLSLGDGWGKTFYVAKLQNGAPEDRFAAAESLCRLGFSEGLDAFLELTLEDAPFVQTDSARRRILQAFDRYIAKRPRDSDVRRFLPGLVLPYLESPTLQSNAFRILGTIAGSDFGYGSWRRLRGDPKAAAVKKSIEVARQWWENEGKKSLGAPK